MVDTARARAEAALRRDATLEAIAFAAQRFLETPDWEAIVPQVLRRLGEAVGVSSLVVSRVETPADVEPRLTQSAAWSANPAGGPPAEPLGGPELSRWTEVLGRGDIVAGHVDEFPEPERRTLEPLGVRSLVVVPIFVRDEWWGGILAGSLERREWSQVEIDALRALAGTIGAAISRRRSEEEVREAEEQLRAAESKYRALVENIPAITYRQTIDGDPELFYISPQVREVFGYAPEEWTWTTDFWIDHIHPDDEERVRAADLQTDRTGEPFDLEYRLQRADGRYAWVHDKATIVRDEHGNPSFWQGFMLDITERKLAEERLEHALEVEREATRRLRGLDDMKNTFLQAVSHDLRTPLAAILGLAVTLERTDLELEVGEARDLARRIAVNARKLDRMVADLLDLDRLARGIVEPKLSRTDVGALVRRVAGESELMLQGRVTLDAPSITARVDPSKVERIVENLLANTARHTPVDTRAWVRVEPADGGVLLVVEDDGPGIPPEHREAIFEPFRQGPDAPEHAPGVGVGLTLVARFAELLGGRAWVQEREGGGASFRVLLADVPEPGHVA
jgi:PAS domain S-box-containing protein